MDNVTVRWVMAGGLVLVGACVLQTETVTGPKPEPGVDPALVAQLQDKISQLEGKLGDLQVQIDDLTNEPTCPRGYEQDLAVTDFVVCNRGVDEVVKVGTGGGAFWIDRYEASLWQDSSGVSQPVGGAGVDYETFGFSRNGQWATPLFAFSKKDVAPSDGTTWFQANEACALSGKRLPTGPEWLRAAKDTQDPGDAAGTGVSAGKCVTSGGASARMTGLGQKCVSMWGAEDMIGNLEEWTGEWFAGLDSLNFTPTSFPDADMNSDGVFNVSGIVGGPAGASWPNLPAAAMRGGNRHNHQFAGIFAMDLSRSADTPMGGFRCVLPR